MTDRAPPDAPYCQICGKTDLERDEILCDDYGWIDAMCHECELKELRREAIEEASAYRLLWHVADAANAAAKRFQGPGPGSPEVQLLLAALDRLAAEFPKRGGWRK